MNNVDKQYLDLLRDILENGSYKETRAGAVKSVFGRQMRFNMKDGLPILTTKKVFTKGVIHELLWFLKGDTNIKYLVDNNVHIWDDDAYRGYLEMINKHNNLVKLRNELILEGEKISYSLDLDDFADGTELSEIDVVSKEEFLERVKNGDIITLFEWNNFTYFSMFDYQYGDCGKIYGHQWRNQGWLNVDQVQNIIDMLKKNPDDRRMICMAWNSNDMNEMVLPPCHYGFQVYTRILTPSERLEWLWEHSNGEYDEWKAPTKETLDNLNVPQRELSLMWSQRSVDSFLGLPFNILSYSILLAMLAQCVNMTCGEVICSLGDSHIYEIHKEAVVEQLTRDTNKYNLPKLVLNKNIKDINDFTYEDIKIEGYESYPTIKAPLCVGL